MYNTGQYCLIPLLVLLIYREPFTSKANQHVLERLAKEVKSIRPETLSSLIKGMISAIWSPGPLLTWMSY